MEGKRLTLPLFAWRGEEAHTACAWDFFCFRVYALRFLQEADLTDADIVFALSFLSSYRLGKTGITVTVPPGIYGIAFCAAADDTKEWQARLVLDYQQFKNMTSAHAAACLHALQKIARSDSNAAANGSLSGLIRDLEANVSTADAFEAGVEYMRISMLVESGMRAKKAAADAPAAPAAAADAAHGRLTDQQPRKRRSTDPPPAGSSADAKAKKDRARFVEITEIWSGHVHGSDPSDVSYDCDVLGQKEASFTFARLESLIRQGRLSRFSLLIILEDFRRSEYFDSCEEEDELLNVMVAEHIGIIRAALYPGKMLRAHRTVPTAFSLSLSLQCQTPVTGASSRASSASSASSLQKRNVRVVQTRTRATCRAGMRPPRW